MRIKAAEILRTYTVASLQQMARHRHVSTAVKTKDGTVKVLTPILYDAGSVDTALSELTKRERLLLDRLILAGGSITTSVIKSQLQQDGLVDATVQDKTLGWGYYSRHESGALRVRDATKFEDLVARLGAFGLVFTSGPSESYGQMQELGKPGRTLFIPEAILKQLPAVAIELESVSAPEVIRAGDPAPLLRDLYLLLGFATREPIPLTARGSITKRAIIRIAGELSRSEDPTEIRSEDELDWLPLVHALAVELALLGASVGALVADPRGPDYFRLPYGERRTRLYEAYKRTSLLSDLHRIPGLEISGKGSSPRTAFPPVVSARQRVLAELAELPAEVWISEEHLLDRIRRRAYEFLICRSGAYSSYYSYYGYSGYEARPYAGNNELGLNIVTTGTEADGWQQVEARFIQTMLDGPLHAMGIVDLGGDAENITAFRITDDGARLLRGEAITAVAGETRVVIQPNFQIFALQPASEDVLLALDQIADRVRMDQAIEYELTRASIHRALQAGMDSAAVVEFLSSVSSVPIPQNVRRSIEEWGGEVERITLRKRTPVIEVLDSAMLDGLYEDPEYAELLGRRVSATMALVPEANLRRLADHLMERGLLPALTEGPNDPAISGPRASIDSDGRVEFRERIPSLFDLAALRPFAELADGQPRLTPESLRRGAGRNHSADEIVATIEDLQAGPLSAAVSAFVRRWAKDWGSGALFESSILQVEQASTLTDLLADPELKPLLQVLPDAPTFALIRRDGVELLRTLLLDRGMSLDDKLLR